MRPSSPNYLPWSTGFMALLMLLLAATLILIEFDVITFAYERLGLHHRTALALLFATLLGSVINVSVAHLRGQSVISDRIVSAFGVRYAIPVVEDWPGTIIAVNLGGALLPLVLSVYLSHQVGHVPQLAIVAVLVAAVTHHFARIEPGVGVVVPVIVPPVAAALLAWFIAPDVRAAAAFVGGTLGALVGADLLNLPGMRGSGAAVASIGGAGTFDGIFVTGIVAVLLA